MRVFVTGPTGWTGTEVVKELLRGGHQVLGLARSARSAAKLRELGVDVLDGDISQPEVLKQGATACDGTIHLAFIHDFSDYVGACAADRAAIAAIGDALEGSGKPFLMTSGIPPAGGQPSTEDTLPDSAGMGAERGKSETLALGYAARGVRACVVRIPITNHGAGDVGFTAHLIGAARAAGTAAYIGEGASRWGAVHRLDTAVCYRLALEKGAAGSVFHAVGDEAVRQKDLAEAIGKKFGLKVESKPAAEVMALWGPMGAFMALDNPASSAKTREQLGWKPVNASLIEDIENGAYDNAVAWPVHGMLKKE
jgi:nucleoside-diphosphate-sugar epimerase